MHQPRQVIPTSLGVDIASRWPGIAQAISPERLTPYLRQTQGDLHKTLCLYLWNIALCESLYPLLNLTETTLRNRLDANLADLFGRREWFDLEWLDARDASKICEARRKITGNRRLVTPGRLVAELTFGFWTSLLDVRYERTKVLWPHLAPQVFAYAPRKLRTRKAQSRYASAIRDLRNRVFHHEPIWHCMHLPAIVKDAKTWLGWMSPEAAFLAKLLDRFHELMEAGPDFVNQHSMAHFAKQYG